MLHDQEQEQALPLPPDSAGGSKKSDPTDRVPLLQQQQQEEKNVEEEETVEGGGKEEGQLAEVRHESGLTARCIAVSGVAACGGLLFGYDTGVVSGVLLLLEEEFALSAFEQELFVGSAIAACVVGSLLAGCWTNDAFGRRPTLLGSAVFFALGAVVLAVAQHFSVLLVGRLLVGLAVGAASLTSPMYIAETAPPRQRGALVTLNNLALTSGQLLAYALASLFVAGGDTALSSSSALLLSSSATPAFTNAWRWLLGLSGVPAAVLLVGMLVAPESPRWLVAQGDDRHEATARAVLRSLLFGTRSSTPLSQQQRIIDAHVQQIKEAIRTEAGAQDSGAAADATKGRSPVVVLAQSLVPCCLSGLDEAQRRKLRGVRRALVVAVGVQAFQQLCGINTAMYYSATIIRNAGFSTTLAIWFSTAVAGANAFSTLVSLFLVDRAGRRVMLCISLLGIAPALVLLGLSFDLSESGLLAQRTCGLMAVGALVVYTLMFALGMGPVPWTLISEVFPMHLRAAGNGIATTTNWLTNLLVSLSFLSLMELLTKAVVFWLFAGICVVALAFVLFWFVSFFTTQAPQRAHTAFASTHAPPRFCASSVPETRQRSLEEIQQCLER